MAKGMLRPVNDVATAPRTGRALLVAFAGPVLGMAVGALAARAWDPGGSLRRAAFYGPVVAGDLAGAVAAFAILWRRLRLRPAFAAGLPGFLAFMLLPLSQLALYVAFEVFPR